jgi:Glycosyl hydrolase family 76
MIATASQLHLRRAALRTALGCLSLAACLGAQALLGPGAAAAKRPSGYPAAATRPAFGVRPGQLASAAARHAAPPRKKRPKPGLQGNPARALRAFTAMQNRYYIPGSGLYAGEPFSYLWPFSQAFAATVTMAGIPALRTTMTRELRARMVGLQSYLDNDNAGSPEGTYTSSLAAFDGTAAPPVGPGGAKYYDDNDWVGIELLRAYRLTRDPAALTAAESIMAFEIAGWQGSPELGCPGGIPFSNQLENSERNTITTAPAAQLALQLYKVTGSAQYLQFAVLAYQWVRNCLLESNNMYGDHVNRRGMIEPRLWSYTQGVMIGAGTMLYQATGNSGYLYQARQTASAALSYFTPERLGAENPFFPSVYFRNLLYLDSVTHDPPGPRVAQAYVDYAWQHLRLAGDLFVAGSPPSGQLLVQAAIVQIYALLSSSPSTYF